MRDTAATKIPPIGDVIRAWREHRGLRLTELAKKAEMRKGYVSELEHNKRANPWPETLAKLAAALDISAMDLVARTMPGDIIEEKTSELEQPERGGIDKERLSSAAYKTPLSTHAQNILLHRLAALEKNLEIAEKSLQNAIEELKVLRALATERNHK